MDVTYIEGDSYSEISNNTLDRMSLDVSLRAVNRLKTFENDESFRVKEEAEEHEEDYDDEEEFKDESFGDFSMASYHSNSKSLLSLDAALP